MQIVSRRWPNRVVCLSKVYLSGSKMSDYVAWVECCGIGSALPNTGPACCVVPISLSEERRESALYRERLNLTVLVAYNNGSDLIGTSNQNNVSGRPIAL